MRILLDISVLGLGHVFPEMRGGTFRVHEHLVEGLARSGECELFLCANYSSVAFVGCAEYVQSSPVLSSLPLLGPGSGPGAGRRRGFELGRVARAAHRMLRPLFPGRVLPASLRGVARGVDRKIHRPIVDVPPGVDVFHSLGARLPPPPPSPSNSPSPHGHRRSPRRLVNIYDLAPLRHPHLYGDNQRFLASERIAGLQREDWVITTSEATRADLAALGGVDPERVFVIPLAADPRIFHPRVDAPRLDRLRHRLGLGGAAPYLLALNAHEPRKNMDAAIRAFTRAVTEGGARDLTLVIVGPASAEPSIQAALADAERQQARVIRTGYVPDEDLATLYRGALAFVYPSLCEGFGLPPLEAMQCGTPVIAGRVASLPEVVGEAGILVDLADAGALGAAMLRLYRDYRDPDGALRKQLSELSLERAASFSWDRCTRQTLAAYRAVTAGKHVS